MKQAVVDRGFRSTGRCDDPASSGSAARAVGSPLVEGAADGVRAVLVERADASCVLYRGGPVGEWPSAGHAWAAIRTIDARLEWRRSTPGVWIGTPSSEPGPAEDGPQDPSGRRATGPGTSDVVEGSFSVARMVRAAAGQVPA